MGETGESGEMGEMDGMVKSSQLAKHGMHVETSDLLKQGRKPRSRGGRSLRTKETFQGDNSHVLINSDCMRRICHKMTGEGQRALKALY